MLARAIRRVLTPRPPKPERRIETEIRSGPTPSITLRAKRGLMIAGAALGFAVAGAGLFHTGQGFRFSIPMEIPSAVLPPPRRDPTEAA